MRSSKRNMSPLRAAGGLAIIYFLLSLVYIQYSGKVALALASTPDELARIESIKGSVFIVFCSLLLFCLAYLYLRRLVSAGLLIQRQREALVSSEKRAMTGMLAASTAHDINNVLMVLEANVDLLRHCQRAKRGSHSENETILMDVEKSLNSLKQLSRRLMKVGKNRIPGDFSVVDIGAIVMETVDLCRGHNDIKHCRIHLSQPLNGRIYGNAEIIQQMLFNLILNAAQAMESNGRIDIGLKIEADCIALKVLDSGPGIPESERDLVFDPFYTTKADGNGLGLISVKACAELHNGSVEICDSPLGGAGFRIILPRDPDLDASIETPNLQAAMSV